METLSDSMSVDRLPVLRLNVKMKNIQISTYDCFISVYNVSLEGFIKPILFPVFFMRMYLVPHNISAFYTHAKVMNRFLTNSTAEME